MVSRFLGTAMMAACVIASLITAAHSEEGSHKSGEIVRDTLSDGALGPVMVVVPAGKFLMGSPENEKGHQFTEGPQIEITIAKPFAVGKYELTWEEWEACVAKRGCEDNSHKAYAANPDPDWTGDAGYGRGARPVINVSWDDADAYVKWLSAETGETYRLLSEAEWEYAARAGSTARFSWGDAEPTCELGKPNRANFNGPHSVGLLAGCNGRQTEPVGFSAPNAFGLYDMHGNVREWTIDCFHVYLEGIPTDGSAWLTGCARGGEGHVFRGGSFTGSVDQMRSASRQATIRREVNMGFRIARELD
ncbi:MAG: formylglycine-generating enzyme family protein [Blastomonas sp.]